MLMTTALVIFGILAVILITFKLWLDHNLKKERENMQCDDSESPDPQVCRQLVIESLERGDGEAKKATIEDDLMLQITPDAASIWEELTEDIRGFFRQYPYGIRWPGLGYLGGVIESRVDGSEARKMIKVYPELNTYVVIGGAEAEAFLAAPGSSRICVVNTALERVDFYRDIYELIYMKTL